MEGRGLFFLMVMRKMRALVQVYLTIIAQSKIRIAYPVSALGYFFFL